MSSVDHIAPLSSTAFWGQPLRISRARNWVGQMPLPCGGQIALPGREEQSEPPRAAGVDFLSGKTATVLAAELSPD
jgi:hypothetical protein